MTTFSFRKTVHRCIMCVTQSNWVKMWFLHFPILPGSAGSTNYLTSFDCLLYRQHFCQKILKSIHVCQRYSKPKFFLRHSVDWGQWLMHDGMPYDPIQGQGHGASEVPIIALFYHYLLHHLQWELASDHWFLNYSIISKFDHARFFIFILVFVSCDLELGAVPAVSVSKTKFLRFQWHLVCR